MADVFYRWPEAAKFARPVPKEKIYAQGTVSGAVRERFVAEVQRITWSYKLAEATINLPATSEVPEVQVFTIESKVGDVSEAVLLAIDKAVAFPIIFELTRQDGDSAEVRMIAAHKQLGTRTPKLSEYYSTGWQPADVDRKPLPTAVTLPALYGALFQQLTPLEARPGEDVSQTIERLATVRKLEREVGALERGLHLEPQLNRKVEIRRTLRTKQQELDQQR